MTSTRERQRAAARARLEKEMAERAAAARKRRQLQAGIGAGVALLLVVAGTVWLVASLGDDETETPQAEGDPAATTCVWNEIPAEQRTPTVKDVGLPPTTTPPDSGTQVMTLDTNFGEIQVTMNLAEVPCTAASFSHLASNQFWDNTKCHRMFPGMLQCGDPSATGEGYRDSDGTGGPTYQYANENLPIDDRPPYPAGVMAMANSGPDTNGSQFFFIYQDVELSPDYTIVGQVTEGLEVIQEATEAGHDGAFDPSPGGGHPNNDILINSLTVSEPQ
ncbi:MULTISPECIES: peptidylprolyl isomerase [unclassified Solwaraspora]|uniref:peptidylprolyl isomerase n=1 Tax=unclassified Solwaraspora TaxID=2627926 RepID=UPI00259BD68A|nr:peptidylprolyl isomerase [Solwaraspora sp. WMMA2056]WJK39351.1 peptidylprolyl isomerase [Solwaraspora sp. WMMA2056]